MLDQLEVHAESVRMKEEKERTIEITRTIKISEFCEKCQPYLHEFPIVTHICDGCRQKWSTFMNELAKGILEVPWDV